MSIINYELFIYNVTMYPNQYKIYIIRGKKINPVFHKVNLN